MHPYSSSSEARAVAAEEIDLLRDLIDSADDADSNDEVRGLKARVILNHMFQFTGLADLDGTLLEANQTALDGGGIERRDVIGRPVWEAHWFTVSGETQRGLQDAIQQAVASGDLVRYDMDVYAGAHGTATVAIDFSARPVHDSHGRVAFLVLEGRDIEEKQRARQAKDQMFANVSHELRTPLTLILGRAKALEQQLEPGPLREEASRVGDNARVLLAKVNDLLQVAALEGSGVPVEPRPTDLAEIARWVAGNFTSLAAERGAGLHVDVPETLPVVTDPEHVETVLVNLVANACRFASEGGVVVVRVATDEDVVIEVRDDGPGVPEQERDRIFDPFHQLDRVASRGHEGTGLGLAIVRQLVELLNGAVRVDQAPEGGARFEVRLPLRRAETADDPHDSHQRPATAAASTLAASRRLDDRSAEVRLEPSRDPRPAASVDHVLVVEDNTDLLDFLRQQLAADYRLSTASDGSEALQLLKSGPDVDLIVTDVMMPGMSGDELVRRLQADGTFASIPVLVVTAREDQALREELLAGGASDYLIKPFSVAELRARIENLLQPVRLSRELERTNAALERYAHQVAHDLKTPITSLIGFADTLLNKHDLLSQEDRDQLLQRLVATGTRLAGQVDDVLADLTDVSGPTCSLAKAVDVATAVLAEPLREHGARVEVDGPLPEVAMGAGELSSVLVNLIENAIHYRAPDRPPRISIRARHRNGECEIAVADNGLGIADADRERIFAEGDRGSDTTKNERPGTGVGLFGCRNLLARHGGHIWVEPTREQGAELRFTLPEVDAGE